PSTPDLAMYFFFFMLRAPPRSPLFPYTTLFRSVEAGGDPQQQQERDQGSAAGEVGVQTVVVAAVLSALGGESDQLGSGAVEAHLRQDLSRVGGIRTSGHRKRGPSRRSPRLRRCGAATRPRPGRRATIAGPVSSFCLEPGGVRGVSRRGPAGCPPGRTAPSRRLRLGWGPPRRTHGGTGSARIIQTHWGKDVRRPSAQRARERAEQAAQALPRDL